MFLPCDVSDIEAGVTPRVQGLQELPLELGIFSHIIFHQVSFILEQQWGAHLGEEITLKAPCPAFGAHGAREQVPALPKPPVLPTRVL